MKKISEQKKAVKKCGFVCIVGRPNVGKSTLLNRILGEKVSIVSPIPQTTRQQIRGIYNDERGQIIFIDTPGLHLGADRLDKFMNRSSVGSLSDVNCVIHVVDSSERVGQEEHNVVEHLKSLKIPIIVGLNKVDLKGKFIHEYIELWEKSKAKSIHEIDNLTLLPISGQTGIHIEKLLDLLFEKMPEGELLYPADTVADIPQRMVIADIVREKLFLLMRQEVPHSIAVMIEEMSPRKGNTLHIRAVILVERDSQKEIVIGHKGAVLKQVGSEARRELEELLEGKVFLELYVKAKNKWRDDHSILEQMGYL